MLGLGNNLDRHYICFLFYNRVLLSETNTDATDNVAIFKQVFSG